MLTTNPNANADHGKRFAGKTRPPSAPPLPGSGMVRDGTSDAVSTRLDRPGAVAWGTTSWRKQVGHAIGEPLLPESHVMCWPQTGQANLNSLMLQKTCVVQSSPQWHFPHGHATRQFVEQSSGDLGQKTRQTKPAAAASGSATSQIPVRDPLRECPRLAGL